jgi:hypothetical protein
MATAPLLLPWQPGPRRGPGGTALAARPRLSCPGGVGLAARPRWPSPVWHRLGDPALSGMAPAAQPRLAWQNDAALAPTVSASAIRLHKKFGASLVHFFKI